MIDTPAVWLAFGVFVALALTIDFLTMRHQGPHRVSLREAAVWSVAWVAVSFMFVAILWWHLGGTGYDPAARALADAKALEFVTGYLIEKALAVDNIFVFLLVFSYFGVPPESQKRVLMYGILGALVLRAVMILAGAWLIAQFHWLLYVFGAFLVFTGVRMWLAVGELPDLDSNPFLRWLRRHMRVATGYDGERFVTRVNGVRKLTPLAAVIVVIGIVDVVFAVDSIPAIFAITLDPFIVLTSNVFAVLGLRALFFLVAAVHERFHLLSYGLAVVLVLIGFKLLAVDLYHVPVWLSLTATLAILVAAITLSWMYPAKEPVTSSYPFNKKPAPADG
ncbi:MAG: TerC family protein [Woeseia sp.]